jgi:hypothetical protein
VGEKQLKSWTIGKIEVIPGLKSDGGMIKKKERLEVCCQKLVRLLSRLSASNMGQAWRSGGVLTRAPRDMESRIVDNMPEA